MTDTVLRLAGITKRFGSLVANDAIDLDLGRGEVLALLGENGAGKTTLMNILFGHYVADAGAVSVAGADGVLRPLPPGSPHAALAAGIGMVHQHFTLAGNLSVLDNIVLGTEPLWRLRQDRSRARQRLAELIRGSGLEVPLDARVGTLTVGEAQRVEILKALYRDARILILDEPTAVLTPQEAESLFATLRRLAARGLAVVFISHKLGEVMALSDRVAVLRGGRKVAEVATAGASRAALAELMVGRAVPEARRLPLEPGAPALELRGVTVPLPRGRSLEAADLVVHAREIVGIAGVSGNGQAALSALLAGLAGRPLARRACSAAPGPPAGRRRWSPPASAASPRTATARGSSATSPSPRTWCSRSAAAAAGSAAGCCAGPTSPAMPAPSSPATTCAARGRTPPSACCPAATCRS
ncbi:MAG: ATP-binding cassette domain-containing protein [Geminicoccaceae bacterium]